MFLVGVFWSNTTPHVNPPNITIGQMRNGNPGESPDLCFVAASGWRLRMGFGDFCKSFANAKMQMTAQGKFPGSSEFQFCASVAFDQC